VVQSLIFFGGPAIKSVTRADHSTPSQEIDLALGGWGHQDIGDPYYDQLRSGSIAPIDYSSNFPPLG
jgi:hypothetical protein